MGIDDSVVICNQRELLPAPGEVRLQIDAVDDLHSTAVIVISRHILLRRLYAAPRFRGRDRLISAIATSFVSKPIRLPDGLKMLLDVSEWIQLEILVHGATEPITLALIRKLVAEGDSVIDVGAHVGHHALVAARAAGARGRVYAIDPQPYNADRIARNAALNGLTNLIAMCAAAGQESGFIKFPIQSDRDRARLSLLERSSSNLSPMVEVPVRRLDEIMTANNLTAPKLVKIDVEGYELEVLMGLGNRLTACRNIILEILERSDAERTGNIAKLLADAGFSLKDVNGQPWQSGKSLPEHNLWASRD